MKLQEAVSQLIAAMNEAGLDYMLVGSFSSMYYSFPRSTTDADFVIGTSEWDTSALADRLGNAFKFDSQLSFELIGETVKKEIQIVGTPFRIELLELTDQAFDQSRFARRRRVSLGGMEVWIPTAEDVILQKLIWSRPRDLDDVIGVIAVNHNNLDTAYLQKWADQLGLTEALDDTWAKAIESRD